MLEKGKYGIKSLLTEVGTEIKIWTSRHEPGGGGGRVAKQSHALGYVSSFLEREYLQFVLDYKRIE
jgi:hypothetical protein